MISLRLNDDEEAAVRRAAASAGGTLSAWLRRAILDAAGLDPEAHELVRHEARATRARAHLERARAVLRSRV